MLLLDSGNFSDNPGAEGDVKTKALLEAMGRLGYSVVNVGDREVRLGYADFARRTQGTPFTYVSSNIVDRKSREPIFAPYTVVEAKAASGKAKVTVGVTGAVRFNPVFLKSGPNGGNMVMEQPLEPVRRAVEALRAKKVDVVVLLAALNKPDVETIVREVPGIDYVLGSYGGLSTDAEERVGQTTLLYCGNRGQRIGESRVFFGERKKAGIASEKSVMHLLTQQYPPDLKMLDFVNAIPKPTPPPTPPATRGPQGGAAADPVDGAGGASRHDL